MLSSLLLVSRVEDGTYRMREQDIYLRDFLVFFPPLRELFPGCPPQIACPEHLMVRADRDMLGCLFQAVAVILATAAPAGETVHMQVMGDGNECQIHILPAIELSFLRDMPGADPGEREPQLVGSGHLTIMPYDTIHSSRNSTP